MKSISKGLLVAALLAATARSWASATFSVIPLPTGYTSCLFYGMSRTGNYAILDASPPLGPSQSNMWSSTDGLHAMTGVSDPRAVSDNGIVVGPGYSWTAAQGAQRIPISDPFGISSDGSVIVGGSGLQYPVALINGTLTTLIAPKYGLVSFASDVSADGKTIVGDYAPKSGNRTSFVWTAPGGVSILPDRAPFNVPRNALYVSGDGRTITGAAHGVWTSQTVMLMLKTSDDQYVRIVSDDRSVILEELNYNTAPYYECGIITTEGEFALRDYLVNHGAFTAALMTRIPYALVSRDGSTIMSEAMDPQGNQQLFRATIDPVPVGPEMADLQTTPNPRIGGNPVNVRAIINGPAPAGGAKVYFSSGDLHFTTHQILGYQSGVLIKAGNTQADEGANTGGYDGPGPTWGFAHASYGTVFEGAYNFIKFWPANVLAVTVPNPSVTGGTVVPCTVRLNGMAGTITNVSINSSDPVAAFTPSMVQVPSGQYSTTFNITTHPVTQSEQVTISLTYLSMTKTVTFTVTP